MKAHSISNVFEGIFNPSNRASKRNKTMDNHKDRYYKLMWLTKKDMDVIEFMSKTCHMSRKDIHDDLINGGLRWVLSNLETDYNAMREKIKTGHGRQILQGEC